MRRVYGIALAGAIPVSLAMIPLGVPIAGPFLGSEWRPAGHAIAALWGLLLGGAISSVAAESAKAIGRPRNLLVRIHGLNLGVTAVLVIAAAIPFGLIGVASAVSVSQVLVGLYAFHLISTHVGMTWREMLAEAVSPLIASALMVAAMVAFAVVTQNLLSHGVALGFLLTGVQVLIGGAMYLAALGFIDPRRRADLVAMRRRLRRWRRSVTPDPRSVGRRTRRRSPRAARRTRTRSARRACGRRPPRCARAAPAMPDPPGPRRWPPRDRRPRGDHAAPGGRPRDGMSSSRSP